MGETGNISKELCGDGNSGGCPTAVCSPGSA